MGRSGLADLVVLQRCSEDELRRVATIAQRRLVPAGTVLIEAGQRAPDLSFVIAGALRIHAPAGPLGTLGRGDVIGEGALAGDGIARADVVAAERTELITIPSAHVPDVLGMTGVREHLVAIAEARRNANHLVEAAAVPIVVRPGRWASSGAGLRPGDRRRPVRSIALGSLALVVAAVTIFVVTQRNRTTVVALDDLLADFEPSAEAAAPPPAGDQPTGTPTSSPVGEADSGSSDRDQAGTVPAAATSEVAGPGDTVTATEPTDTAEPSTAPAAPAPSQPTTPRWSFPVEGVYTYDTEGSEKISIAGARHEYPDQTHAAVRRTGGCGWQFDHRVIEEHRDTREHCLGDTGLVMTSTVTEITFFGQSDGLHYLCDPGAPLLADLPPGTRQTGTCVTEDRASTMEYDGLFVGLENRVVDGIEVETVHLEVAFELRGDAEGESRLDIWLVTDTGLPVRIERTTDTKARSVWGDVRYEEEATFDLVSLTPRT